MTDTTNRSLEPVLLAIDIAKRSHDVAIHWPSGKIKMLEVPNTLEGYPFLLDATDSGKRPVQAAFEPRADYHRNLAYWAAGERRRVFSGVLAGLRQGARDAVQFLGQA